MMDRWQIFQSASGPLFSVPFTGQKSYPLLQ